MAGVCLQNESTSITSAVMVTENLGRKFKQVSAVRGGSRHKARSTPLRDGCKSTRTQTTLELPAAEAAGTRLGLRSSELKQTRHTPTLHWTAHVDAKTLDYEQHSIVWPSDTSQGLGPKHPDLPSCGPEPLGLSPHQREKTSARSS